MRLVGLVLAATVALGACSGDGSNPGAAVEGATLERTTTTTTIPPAPHLESTSTVPVQLLPPAQVSRSGTSGKAARPAKPEKLSWDGQKFEIGVIRNIVQAPNGGWVMAFDPVEIHDSKGTRAGKQLTTDPLVAPTRPTVANASTALKLFGVAAGAIVHDGGLSSTQTCSSVTGNDDLTMDDLARRPPAADELDSLTFDANGQVTVVNLSHSC